MNPWPKDEIQRKTKGRQKGIVLTMEGKRMNHETGQGHLVPGKVAHLETDERLSTASDMLGGAWGRQVKKMSLRRTSQEKKQKRPRRCWRCLQTLRPAEVTGANSQHVGPVSSTPLPPHSQADGSFSFFQELFGIFIHLARPGFSCSMRDL